MLLAVGRGRALLTPAASEVALPLPEFDFVCPHPRPVGQTARCRCSWCEIRNRIAKRQRVLRCGVVLRFGCRWISSGEEDPCSCGLALLRGDSASPWGSFRLSVGSLRRLRSWPDPYLPFSGVRAKRYRRYSVPADLVSCDFVARRSFHLFGKWITVDPFSALAERKKTKKRILGCR